MQQQPAKVVFLDREILAPEIHLAELTFPHELVTFGRTSPAETAERIRAVEFPCSLPEIPCSDE